MSAYIAPDQLEPRLVGLCWLAENPTRRAFGSKVHKALLSEVVVNVLKVAGACDGPNSEAPHQSPIAVDVVCCS